MAKTFKSDEEYIFKAEFKEDYGLLFMPTGESIVRCKDCKHFHKAEPTNGDISNVSYCMMEDDRLISFPNEDDFCSRGERKNDDRK